MKSLVSAVVGTGGLCLVLYHGNKWRVNCGRSFKEKGRAVKKWDNNWDHMEPKSSSDGEPNPPKPTASRHLILIRHGQYEMDHSESDKKVLTTIGRQQAAATGKRLKQLNKPYQIILHSTLIRAVQTATIISESLPDVPIKSTDMLKEGAPIVPEPPVTHWQPAPWHVFQDGARIEACFRKLFHRAHPDQKEDSTEIIVCHANVIRYFVCRALQLPPEAWLRIGIGHCGLTTVTIRPNGRVSLKSLGDTGHLPPELLTFS